MSEIYEGELIPKGKAGAPRKYTSEIPEKFLRLRFEGKTEAQAMLLCDIRSWETLKRWQNDYPDFKEAVEFGKIAAQAYWEGIGDDGIVGNLPKFSHTAYIFKMCNMFKEQYRQANNGSQVNVQVNNTTSQLSDLSTEELNQRALELSKKLIQQETDNNEHICGDITISEHSDREDIS